MARFRELPALRQRLDALRTGDAAMPGDAYDRLAQRQRALSLAIWRRRLPALAALALVHIISGGDLRIDLLAATAVAGAWALSESVLPRDGRDPVADGVLAGAGGGFLAALTLLALAGTGGYLAVALAVGLTGSVAARLGF